MNTGPAAGGFDMPGRLQWGPWAVAALAIPLFAGAVLADWPANGAPVSVFPCDEVPTSAIADGAGGMFLFWNDNRTCGRSDAYLQRITGSGAVAPGWPDQGLPVCSLFGGQSGPTAVSDGASGVIVVWMDSRSGTARLFAERIGPGGTRLWAPQGVPVCDATGSQVGYDVLSDGAAGVFVAWMDTRRGLVDDTPHHHPLFDLYAQR